MYGITGNKILDLMIMESDEKRQKLEQLFYKYIIQGADPNEIQEVVYQEAGFDCAELLDVDRNALKKNVEEMVKRYGK